MADSALIRNRSIFRWTEIGGSTADTRVSGSPVSSSSGVSVDAVASWYSYLFLSIEKQKSPSLSEQFLQNKYMFVSAARDINFNASCLLFCILCTVLLLNSCYV